MQLSVCFVLASSLLAWLSYLYERSSKINYLLLVIYNVLQKFAKGLVMILVVDAIR